MKNHNYPVFLGSWDLNSKDLWEYVSMFPEHEIRFYYIHEELVSSHRYKCGLVINLVWDKNDRFFRETEELSHIFKNAELGKIKLRKANINRYSVYNLGVPTPFAATVFEERFQHKRRKISGEDYQEAEYNVDSLALTDDDILRVLEPLRNTIEFERFYSERQKLQKPKQKE